MKPTVHENVSIVLQVNLNVQYLTGLWWIYVRCTSITEKNSKKTSEITWKESQLHAHELVSVWKVSSTITELTSQKAARKVTLWHKTALKHSDCQGYMYISG